MAQTWGGRAQDTQPRLCSDVLVQRPTRLQGSCCRISSSTFANDWVNQSEMEVRLVVREGMGTASLKDESLPFKQPQC